MQRRGFVESLARVGVSGSTLYGLWCRGWILGAIAGCRPADITESSGDGYGDLGQAGPELDLPVGFSYRVLSRDGQAMTDGNMTPPRHDGMAAFAAPNGNVRLIRNHEVRGGPSAAFGTASLAYDPSGAGGAVCLEVEPGNDRRLVRDFVALGGTIVNCAGGPTPWGTYLSCEEHTGGAGGGWERPHGYVFEVDPLADAQGPAVPLIGLGRFVHEAVAVDPRDGAVYLTEDRPDAGLYRFRPTTPGRLSDGGVLTMLAVAGQPNENLATGQAVGEARNVEWVTIADVDPADAEANPSAVFDQGWAHGAARFARLEGCWFADGNVYAAATSGGDAGLGQVWRIAPNNQSITLIFESTDPAVLNRPDNITASPRGGLLICEDHGGSVMLRGLRQDGRMFDFARNRLGTEFTGPTYSPDGHTLFVNTQGSESMTIAIWGEWTRGAL